MVRLTCLSLCAAILALSAAPALAQKASDVTKVEGAAYVVRCDPASDWLAAWSLQPSGRYKLLVINGANGEVRSVTTSANSSGEWSYPGGLSWIPNHNRLLFTYGIYNQVVNDYKVYYYTYDVATRETTKELQITDRLETYLFDPIPAEDGSRVFHMLIGPGDIPVFLTYLPDSGQLVPRDAVSQLGNVANIASEYDLSSDGNYVYWPLHNPDTGDYVIVGWDLNPENWVYREAYTYGASADPADDHAGIKIDSRHMQAAVFAMQENDPTLQLCIYNFQNTDSLYVLPIHLGATEQVQDFDWKGTANTLYMLVLNTATNKYSIDEIDPAMGQRRTLYTSDTEISFVDYAVSSKTYYFTEVENPDSSRPRTKIRRYR